MASMSSNIFLSLINFRIRVLFYCHLISAHLVGLNRFINPLK